MNNTTRTILIIVGIAAIGGIGYWAYKKYQEKEESDEHVKLPDADTKVNRKIKFVRA